MIDDNLNTWELEMLDKIDSGQELSEDEVEKLVYEYEYETLPVDPDCVGRWNESVTEIVRIGDRFFALWWLRGNTEMQENGFECQTAIEVKRKKVTVTKWVDVKKNTVID